MSTVLFAFLGTANYSPAVYAFGKAGHEQAGSRFVAHAMVKVSARSSRIAKPDRIILCGTRTSGWQALVDALQNPDQKPAGPAPEPEPQDMGAVLALEAQYSALLGAPVSARLISFGVTPQEQAAFVSMVASHVDDGDIVHFDVTHGLRHLPMLALVAALAVRSLRNAEIGGIWYGAWELKNQPEGIAITGKAGLTPMIKLDGLLAIAGWLAALSAFDATGNVGAFVQPLRQEGKNGMANDLAAAAFTERVTATHSARASARLALEQLGEVTTGIAAVVRPAIESRLAWADAPEGINAGFDHALRFAGTGNEARAITLVYETALEKFGEAADIVPDPAIFPRAVAMACKNFIARSRSQDFTYASTYLAMKDLRHDLVHLRRPSRKCQDILASPANFKSRLTIQVQILRKSPPQELVAEIRTQYAMLTER